MDKKPDIELQNVINKMSQHALHLYELMQPGMTITVSFEEPKAILVPNAQPELRHIVITKPINLFGLKLTAEAKK